MPTQQRILSSRRTALLAMLPDYEKFLIDFYPERDAMQIDPLIAKIEQLSIDLETVQCQLEDAAVTHDEIVHNAVVRDDYYDRLIRIEAVLKSNKMHLPRNESAGIISLAGTKQPTIALPGLAFGYTRVNNTAATPSGKQMSYQHKKAKPLREANSPATTYAHTRTCPICYSQHSIEKCPQFMLMNSDERYQNANTLKLCLNCLHDNHHTRDCSSQHKCKHCSSAHHTLIHTPHYTRTFATAPKPAAPNAPACNTQNTGTFSTASTPAAQNVSACYTHKIGAFSTATKPAAQNAPVTHTHNTDDHTASTQTNSDAALRQTSEKVLSQTAVMHASDAHSIMHPTSVQLDGVTQLIPISDRFAYTSNTKPNSIDITLTGADQFSIPVQNTVLAKFASKATHYELDVDVLMIPKLFEIFYMPSVACMASRNESTERFCKEEEAQVNDRYSLKVRKHEKFHEVTKHQAVHLHWWTLK